MVFDRPWEGNECGEFTCLRDNGLYRIYYRASNASRDEQGNIVKRSPMYVTPRVATASLGRARPWGCSRQPGRVTTT